MRYGTFLPMKHYAIDELRYQDYEKLRDYLPTRFPGGGLPGIFRIPLGPEHLSREQAAHVQCHPFYCTVELEENKVTVEFLVRSENRLRCSCVGYAGESTRLWLMRLMDEIFEDLGLIS